MNQQPTVAAKICSRALCVLALGALLAGCDKCGDWWFSPQSNMQVCKPDTPKPPQ